MALDVGSRLGVFEVTGRLGEGGMGVVYRATDTSLNRDVALKVLPDAFANDPERLARFEREAKVLASLNHPNIAAIYGFEKAESGDTRALILELVEGPTLQDRIAKGPIPLDEALPIARQIAEALEAAHEQGIIHRDLKPANVKVKDDGTVKVLDFGLAKALQPELSDLDAANSPTMTMTAAATKMGVIMGTAAYMSPEQAKGRQVDKRADIWAFGVVLYEMLTGRQAFGGTDISETLAAVLRKDLDWNELPSETPHSVRRLLRRCLERDHKRRLPEIGTARLDIDEADDPAEPSTGEASAKAPLPTFWQRPAGLATVAIVALGLGGLAVWTSTRPNTASTDFTRFEILPPDDAPMSVQLGPRDLTISPDGTLIVYDGVPPGENLPRLHVRRLDGTDAVALRGADLAMGPFVSPDGEWVGFLSQPSPTTLRKISVLGGQPLTVTESPSLILGTSWGRDNLIVFGTIDGGLFRVPAGGGEGEPLAALDPELGETSHAWPSVIPDRDAILFVISSGSPLQTGQLAVLDLTNREVTRLGLAGVGPHYAPTGHLVYAAEDGSVRAAAFDVNSLAVTSSPVPLVEEIIVKQDGTADFSISDGGTLLYTRSQENLGAATRTLAWVDRHGVREPLVGAPADSYASVALSPSGTDVAMEIFDRSGAAVAAVWTFNLERGTFNRVTNEPGLTVSPLWTLDGRRIVYGSGSERGEGSGGLFWRNADGTGDPERLVALDGASTVSPWAWSPDGAWLLFRGRTGSMSDSDIGMISMEGDRSVEWLFDSEFGETHPSISPDGDWIAYTSNRSGRDEVYVERFPALGNRQVVSTDGGERPRWSPDGRELFYFSGDDASVMAVPVDTDDGGDGNFSAGTPSVVFEGVLYQNRDNAAYDVAANGERFLVISPTSGVVGALGDIFTSPPIHVVLNWVEELQARVPTGR